MASGIRSLATELRTLKEVRVVPRAEHIVSTSVSFPTIIAAAKAGSRRLRQSASYLRLFCGLRSYSSYGFPRRG